MSSSGIITLNGKNGTAQQNTAARLLFFLKTRGPLTISAMARLAGSSAENIRQQLQKCAAEKLVETCAVEKRHSAGRPVQLWQLTEKGNSRFPDSHAELTVTLLRHMNALGEGLTEQIIALREQEMLENYRAAMSGISETEQRIAALTRLRSEEGYMSEWRKQHDGTWLLIENHCPICAAATSCRGFCRSELNIFQAVLGDNYVIERCEHILHGARRCAYRIFPANGAC
ncbi:helix-turn-helix transcriptional regulator [Pseudochrobactrum sp. HB0163]|uniref:helix-turn-helix transcriptional regulator n=1 Tax=Pseudochrobactrum sp. HB0163 TaxID=3450708 RepID=UPI003F6DC26D